MKVKVNNEIRNRLPKQDIRGKCGKVIHKVDDGYWLIEFKEFKIRKRVEVGSKAFLKELKSLQWYVHKDDLTIQ